ncbi:MAG: YfhO family protein, partial [Planctomycetota bacterium]
LVKYGPYDAGFRDAAPPSTNLFADSAVQFVPWLRYAADAFAADHHLPFWKSTSLCGAPLLGNGQSALFFPFTLLSVAIGAPPWIHAVIALVKLAGGAWFAFLLARHYRQSFAAALVAGFTFGFGGFAVTNLLYPQTTVAFLLPLLMLATELVVREGRPRHVAFAAIVAGLQHLGGHAETAFHCQLVAFGFGGARVLLCDHRSSTGDRAHAMVRLAGAYVLGAMLGAIQILPQVEYILQSDAYLLRRQERQLAIRLHPFASVAAAICAVIGTVALSRLARARRPWATATVMLAATYAALCLGLQAGLKGYFPAAFAADWFGDVRHYRGLGNYAEAASGFGGLAWPLALIALWFGSERRPIRIWFALGIIGALIGWQFPVVADIATRLPVLKLSALGRFVLFSNLALAILAGSGFDTLASGVSSLARSRFLLGTAGMTLATLAVLLTGSCTRQLLPLKPMLQKNTIPLVLADAPTTAVPGAADLTTFRWRVSLDAVPTQAYVLFGASGFTAALITPGERTGANEYELVAQIRRTELAASPGPMHAVVALASGKVAVSRAIMPPRALDLLGFPVTPETGGKHQLWALAAAIASMVLAMAASRRTGAIWRSLALVQVVVAMVGFACGVNPSLPRRFFYPSSPRIEQLTSARPDGRVLLVNAFGFRAEAPTYHHIAEAGGYDALQPRRIARLLRAALGGRDPAEQASHLAITRPPDLRLLGLMSVRYIADLCDQPRASITFPELTNVGDDRFRVWQNPGFLPRARLLKTAIVESDDERALALLSAPGTSLERVAILASGEPLAADGEEGSAEITWDRPDCVGVSVRSDSPAVLVLSDTDFPGWHAYVDGAERPITRANLAFRAVRVEPGDHLVEFRYRPASARWGASLAIAAAIIIAILALRRSSGRQALAAS